MRLSLPAFLVLPLLLLPALAACDPSADASKTCVGRMSAMPSWKDAQCDSCCAAEAKNGKHGSGSKVGGECKCEIH